MRNFMDVISPSGPRVSFRHTDEQILILILVRMPQPTPSEYLINTYMITPLWCDY
jgi:hypothetical protein